MIVLCVSLSAGCASNVENLQRETARQIGGNVSPQSVNISNVDRGVTTVKWNAQSAQGAYSCSADDMVRSVLCVKQ